MIHHKKTRGYSLVELMVTISMVGILAAFAAPSMKKWGKSYNVQSAASDLYSHIQIARLGAVKENKPWSIRFNPGGLVGYDVRNSAGNAVKRIDFRQRYDNEIQFTDPTATKTYDVATFIFNPSGVSTANTYGYVYISNKSRSSYYRIGTPYASGTVKIEKWNGTAWK